MSAAERYPHGECECRQWCQCQRNDPGPAAEEITRDGKRLRVCTRCKLTGDTDRVWLVTKAGDIEVLGGDNARESHS